MRRRVRRAHGFEALQTVLVVAVAAALLLTLKLAWASDVRPAFRQGTDRVLGPVEAGARSRAPTAPGPREPAPAGDRSVKP